MNVGATFIANSESSELMQPAQGPFHDPAQDTETTSVLRVATGDEGPDLPGMQLVAVGVRIVGPVGKHHEGPTLGTAGFSFDRRDGVYQGEQLRHVMTVGTGDGECQRDPLSIRDEVMLRSKFAPVGGIGARFQPPKTARTLALSTTARDQSSWSARRNRARSISCTRCQTPWACQSRRRRQHVIPHPQPSSCGKYSHGIPVRRTNRIPVKALRLGTGGRPLLLGGLSGGRRGSMSVHRSSGRISRAIGPSLQPHVHVSTSDSLALYPRYRSISHKL